MDKVTRTDCTSGTSSVITLAFSSLKDEKTSFKNNVLKLLLGDDSSNTDFEFSTEGICHHYRVHGRIDVYMMQHYPHFPNTATPRSSVDGRWSVLSSSSHFYCQRNNYICDPIVISNYSHIVIFTMQQSCPQSSSSSLSSCYN